MKELRQILLLFTSLLLTFSAFALFQKEENTLSTPDFQNIPDERSLYEVSARSCASTRENTSAVAQVIVGGSEISYSVFEDALDAWKNGATLKLLQDVKVRTLEILDEKTLDLNGFSLCGDGSDSVLYLNKNADLTVKGEGEIIGGKARRGGGIYGENAKLSLIGTTVRENSAKEGGGVYLKNCEFSATDATVSANQAETGGGLYLFECNADLSNFIVEKNTSFVSGGGIYLWGEDEDAVLSLEDGTVRENEAAEGGGGISSFSRGRIELSAGTEISKNKADCGGGMYLQGGHGNLDRAQATLKDAVFFNNSARVGGGVNVVSNGVLYAEDVKMFDNSAQLGGGVAISIYGEAVFSKTCSIMGNKNIEGAASNVYLARSGQAEITADFTGEIGFSMPRAGAVGKIGVASLDGLSADETELMTLEMQEKELYLRYLEQTPSYDPSDTMGSVDSSDSTDSEGAAGSDHGGQGDKNVGIENGGANADMNVSTKEGERAIAIMIAISAACAVLFLAGSLVSRIFHRRQERED